LLFIATGIKKRLFGKLDSCPSILPQSSPSRSSVFHSLHALPVVGLVMRANSSAQAKHCKERKAHSRLLLSCVLSNVQTFALRQKTRSV